MRAVNRHPWMWLTAGVVVVIASVFAVGALTAPPRPAAVLASLQRPASPSSAPRVTTVVAVRGQASLRRDGIDYLVRLVPNRASLANRLTITASAGGRPLSGAAISVGFSMPAMDMWRAFSLVLRPAGGGRYVAAMPFVGMPGAWRLDVRVSGLARRSSAFAISDALGS